MLRKNNVIEVETMSSFLAVETIENGMHISWEFGADDIIEAYQFLINNGIIWKLQGSYISMALALIDDGLCTCDDTSCKPKLDTFLA